MHVARGRKDATALKAEVLREARDYAERETLASEGRLQKAAEEGYPACQCFLEWLTMARMAVPTSLEEVFILPPEKYDLNWAQIDALVGVMPLDKQIEAWQRIADRIDELHSKGRPLFRLSALKLLTESDESSLP